MRRNLLWLNIAILILSILVPMGILSIEVVFLVALIISIVNMCFAASKSKLIIYNFVLFVCLTIGIILDYLECKNYGVGFHPGTIEAYQFLMGFLVVCSLVITVIEIVLKHFLGKKK